MAFANTQYRFTNTTIDSRKEKSQVSWASLDLSRSSTPSWSSNTTGVDDGAPFAYSTPLSSAASEELIDPVILLAETRLDDGSMDPTPAKDSSEVTQVVLDETHCA
ncbi:hypothetical protein AUP68_00604 [Ilyonectria robusta]